MKLISWNVNGIRAAIKKGFLDYFNEQNADIFCLQETKLSEGQLDLELKGYYQYWNYAEKKGYSGTAIFTKQEPLSVSYGLGIEEHDKEGRVITLEFEKFYMVTVYTPNSKDELLRLDYRMVWEDEFRKYLKNLEKKKPVVVCGDLNVAHKEIDLKNPKTNHKNAGFTDEEREKMSIVLSSGFTDSFRYKYPDKTDMYSWWSYMGGARAKNIGWRIDYFIVSDKLKEKITDAKIHANILGSEANDLYYLDNNQIKTKTNNNGGILGGLSTGMPLVFSVVVKPTSSISLEQKTVNIKEMKEDILKINGRHDVCIVPRVLPVIEAVMALAILDEII